MLARILKVVLGVLLTIAGIAMLVLPGPGLLAIAFGIGLILSQSEPGRRVMARIRLWARDRFGSDKVRGVEGRLPREIIGDENTRQMRINLEEYEKRRKRDKR